MAWSWSPWKHASCAILAGQGRSGPTSVEGICFRKRLRKHATAEARIGREHATGLTGARKSNVLAMKWADLELKRGLWKISEAESKNKEPLVCILHPTAVEILQRRHIAAKDKPSEYVFPSWGSAGHITETKTAWKRIIDRVKIKNLRLHDLRRTLESWQAATGASLSIIGRSLGHKNIATTAVYARLDLDPVRASVNMAGDKMLACLPADADNGEKVK